jgi:hypothetical protein
MKDFDPNSQNLGPYKDSILAVGGTSANKGGGSQPTPQTQRMRAGSGKVGSSAPKSPQKLRG